MAKVTNDLTLVVITIWIKKFCKELSVIALRSNNGSIVYVYVLQLLLFMATFVTRDCTFDAVWHQFNDFYAANCPKVMVEKSISYFLHQFQIQCTFSFHQSPAINWNEVRQCVKQCCTTKV